MGGSSFRLCALLEIAVVLFQICGVAALCLNRLLPATPWAKGGRIAFVVALLGLGFAGALCGRHDSEFALFAGVTLTILLIGMTSGTGQHDPSATARVLVAAEANLAG
jgi:hypothetical protein